MNSSVCRIALVICSVLLMGGSGHGAVVAVNDPDSDVLLQAHLPREVTVHDPLLNLGQVTVVRGPRAVATKVSAIGLGRLSVPGQKLVVDRATILSRLASSGIPAAQVRLTGANAVTVRRQQEIIETEDFIEVGRQMLRQYPAARSACEIIPVARPKDLVLSEQPEHIQLTPQLTRGGAPGHVTVQVRVTADGQEAGTRDISFRLKYKRRKVVTLTQIPAGAVVSPENVKIETTVSDYPEPAGWKPPYGLAATRTLAANSEIRAGMVDAPKSSVVVRRNETVQIRLERPGILVTATGTALQEAHAGECLKVRNADSNRIIMCQVKSDGTVEPVL